MADARSRRAGQRDVSARGARALVWALALGVGACVPIPYRHMELVTPQVTGILQHSDGSPVAGEVVAVSTRRADATCGQSGPRAVTDSLGRFQLPKVTKHRQIFWLTMIESFGSIWYSLCAGPSDSINAPTGFSRAHVDGYVGGDSLTCLSWEWRDERRVTCDGRFPWRVVSGGSWTERGRHGVYRLIYHPLAEYDWEQRVFVQWVETSAKGTPIGLRATAELPTADGVQSEHSSPIHALGEEWGITVKSIKTTSWANAVYLTFKLGAPGQLTFVPDIPADSIYVRRPGH